MYHKCNDEEFSICTKTNNNTCCFDCGQFLTCQHKCNKIKREKINDVSKCKYANEAEILKGEGLYMDKEKFEELKEASKPLLEFLKKYYNPMTVAIVSLDRVDIMQSEIGIPLNIEN